MRKFEYTLQIKEHHLDTFGHVNNAIYLQLYEEARWDFITGGEFGLDEVVRRQQGPVILEVNLRFKRELKNRQIIRIESETIENKGRILKIFQKMVNPTDGQIHSEATFVVGYMDFGKRKLVEPPAAWLKAIGYLD